MDHLLNSRPPLNNHGKVAELPGEGQLRTMRGDFEKVRALYAQELEKLGRARERLTREAGPDPDRSVTATMDRFDRDIARLRELVQRHDATIEEIDRRLAAIANKESQRDQAR